MKNKKKYLNSKQSSVESPCVRNCCLNDEDICLGCFRTLTEIISWGQTDDQVRSEILVKGYQRRKEYSVDFLED